MIHKWRDGRDYSEGPFVVVEVSANRFRVEVQKPGSEFSDLLDASVNTILQPFGGNACRTDLRLTCSMAEILNYLVFKEKIVLVDQTWVVRRDADSAIPTGEYHKKLLEQFPNLPQNRPHAERIVRSIEYWQPEAEPSSASLTTYFICTLCDVETTNTGENKVKTMMIGSLFSGELFLLGKGVYRYVEVLEKQNLPEVIREGHSVIKAALIGLLTFNESAGRSVVKMIPMDESVHLFSFNTEVKVLEPWEQRLPELQKW